MAYYAALVQVVQLLDDIRHDQVRYRDVDLGKQQITISLHEKFILLQKSLDDNYYSSSGDESSDKLERKIRDVSYLVQDIIEPHISEEKTHIHTNISNRQPLPQVYGLERVDEEVDSIFDELVRINESYVKVVDDDYVDIDSSTGSKLSPPAESSKMVGFEEHVITIKEKLCGGSSQLQTIPITGMGGIGKTTLAQNIFTDKLIVGHFDVRAWVTVSQDYHKENMLRAILDSIKAVSSRERSFTQSTVDIHKQLINRRYLIIVDDVWSTNVLDDINRISPDNSNGSRIMITTRLSDVANYGNTFSFVHQMQYLNDEQSWHLFQERVFAPEEGCVCPPELEDLGKSIVRNCRGLPLAIVVIAGVLSKVKRTQTDWNKIASNVNSIAAENDEHFSRIFSLSYNHLPHHLKPCFLYIGAFPEDNNIQVSQLIKLWMAEGFLNNNNSVIVEGSKSSSKRRRSLEEVGEEYLEDLVKRNLILITQKNIYNGKIEVCGIHDILRDLCQERCWNENFFHFTDKYGMIPKYRGNNVRRACVYPYYNEYSLSTPITIGIPDSSARSILCFGEEHVTKTNWNISWGCLKLLRVFDALEIEFQSFPDKLLELFHLRYIALFLHPKSSTVSFTTTKLIEISPLICQLQNLQTLIVRLGISVNMLSLPKEMWKMAQLRHVLIDDSFKMPPPVEVGILPLENLQTLETLTNYRFTEEAVAMFPNLKILKVEYTEENEKWKWEEWLNNISNLCQLEELEIDVRSLDFLEINDIKNNGFPRSLKKLRLSKCNIPWERISSVVGCLPNLEQLQLINTVNGTSEEWEPKPGEFQSLKYLLIDDEDLKYWRANHTNFPRLVHLTLRWCSKLEEIPLEIGDIPTLQFIDVYKCSESAMESARLIQQQQEDIGNDSVQVFF